MEACSQWNGGGKGPKSKRAGKGLGKNSILVQGF